MWPSETIKNTLTVMVPLSRSILLLRSAQSKNQVRLSPTHMVGLFYIQQHVPLANPCPRLLALKSSTVWLTFEETHRNEGGVVSANVLKESVHKQVERP